ncbi:MAG: hypothetical protein ACFFDN_18560 [Candidatus Hodarchaeota archaeon]
MKKSCLNVIIVIQTVTIMEFLGVMLWGILIKSLDLVPINFIIIGLCTGYLLFISKKVLFKNSRKDLKSDERTEKNFERSYMFGGIAGILVLVQLAIMEILTGITFSTIVILIIVGLIFYVTMLITAIIQYSIR